MKQSMLTLFISFGLTIIGTAALSKEDSNFFNSEERLLQRRSLVSANDIYKMADQDKVSKIDTAIARATTGMMQPIDNVDSSVIVVPTNPDQPVMISGPTGTIALKLPTTNTAGTAVRTSAGTTIYSNSHSSAAVAVQTLAGGARVLVILQNADAPHEYRFPISLPEGHRIEAAKDNSGAIDIIAELDGATFLVGKISAPWAKDARGVDLRTAYRIEGNAIVQTVSFDDHTVFPVVADPNFVFNIGFTSSNITFSRRYTKEVLLPAVGGGHQTVKNVLQGVDACGGIPDLVARGICIGLVSTSIIAISHNIRQAAAINQCLTMRLGHSPLLSSIGINSDRNCKDR